MKKLKKKDIKNVGKKDYPVIVRCFACNMIHIIENTFPVVFRSSALGTLASPDGNRSKPSVKDIAETVFLCQRDFNQFVTKAKYPDLEFVPMDNIGSDLLIDEEGNVKDNV